MQPNESIVRSLESTARVIRNKEQKIRNKEGNTNAAKRVDSQES